MKNFFINNKEVYVSKSHIINYIEWLIQKIKLDERSNLLENNKKNNLHPIRPRKGDIYLIEFGYNIGHELNNIHMGIIMQNSLKNSVSSTVIVIPISSSSKIYDTQVIITNNDMIEGKLNKIPSKAKSEQITCVDKARLIHKVGKISDDFILRLEKKILIALDIK